MSKNRKFQILFTIVLIAIASLATISAVDASATSNADLTWPPLLLLWMITSFAIRSSTSVSLSGCVHSLVLDEFTSGVLHRFEPAQGPKSSKESKEFEMSRSRLFNALIAAALATVVALTIWQSVETTLVVSAAQNENRSCFSGMDRLSLTAEYVPEDRAWIPRTHKGPTGLDGGLLELLSNDQPCSR